VVEVLSYAHGRDGRHPASWSYRPREHYRWVLLPGIDVKVMLVTSWMAVNAVLCSGASPGIRFPLIGHNERYPDFNTLLSGGLHAQIRNIIGPIIGKRNAQRDAMLRDTARQLVTKLDLTGGPADLREGYSVPMIQALATSLGFPESEYRDAVMRPTAVQQRLVGDAEDMKEVRQALKDLLEYCRDLDRELRKRPDTEGIPLVRIAAIMRAQGLPDEAHLAHVPHSGNGLRDAGRRRPGQVPGEAGPYPGPSSHVLRVPAAPSRHHLRDYEDR
jgi:hypothetical protein